ncbi:MAG: metalloregulator ArsR/SmtB family transcription factor [Pseudomonadota bacterium]
MTAGTQETFRALADPTRRDILAILATADCTIAEVADGFDMTRPAVKKHLAILERGGLITVEPRGRERINRLAPDGLRPVVDWIATLEVFWDDRLTALKSAIEKDLS